MRVSVAFFNAALTLAAVRIKPSWIARLFGSRERDDIARRDRTGWCWDSSDQPITDRRILDAIDRQLTVDAAVRRVHSLLTRQ